MSKYPSEIITDTSFDKYLNDDAFANIRVPAYDNIIANKVLYYASQFLSMEKSYNVNGAYNFGLIPYYYAQKFINSQSTLQDTFNDLVNEYIINTYNYRYNTVNIIKVKILFVQILSVLTGNINNEDITSMIRSILTNKLPEIKIIQQVIDTYDITVKGRFRVETFLDHVCKNVNNTYYNGKNIDYLMVRNFAIKKWIESNNITKDNVLSYKSQLGKYYDLAIHCLNDQSITEDITYITDNIDNMIEDILNVFDDSPLSIPANNNQKIAEMMFKHQYSYKKYLVYIYTSFIIYHVVPNCDGGRHSVTMRIPSLNDYDSGNGRTAEFLLSKVYEDIINYAIYNALVNQSDYYTDESWNEWTHAKQVADTDILYYKDNVTVMNVNKFLSWFITLACPSTFHPSIHDVNKSIHKSISSIKNTFNDEHTYCHFINNILLRNVYNIFNIDAQYIIIHKGITINFSDDISVIIAGLIDWSSKFYMLFKPLKNLWNYYYSVKKLSTYDNYTTMVAKIDDTIVVNNYNTGGDLYSVYNGIFTLIDVKNYDYSDKYNTQVKLRNLYYHTILQTWLYMNAYIKPIGMINDNKLYTYHLAVVNPYLNETIACDYDKVTEFTKDIDLSEYRFNTPM